MLLLLSLLMLLLLLTPRWRSLRRLRSPRGPLPCSPLRSLNLCALLLFRNAVERQLKLLQRRSVVCELPAAPAGLRRRRGPPRLRLVGLGTSTPRRCDLSHAPLPHLLKRNLARNPRARTDDRVRGMTWVRREVIARLVARRRVLLPPHPIHCDDGRRGGRPGGPRGSNGCSGRGVRVGRAAVAEPPRTVAQRWGARHLGHSGGRRGVELQVPAIVVPMRTAVSSPVGDVRRVIRSVELVRGRAWS